MVSDTRVALRKLLPPDDHLVRWCIECAGIAAIYFAAARVGLLLSSTYKNISPVWPPSGVALAILMCLNKRLWPGIFVGAMVANWYTGLPFNTAVVVAIGNTIEGVTAAAILSHGNWFQTALSRVRDVQLLILVAVVAPVTSATVGVAALLAGGIVDARSLLPAFATWWLGDAMGILVFSAVIMPWLSPPPPDRKLSSAGGRWLTAELSVLAVLLVLLSQYVFTGGKLYPYAVFPPLAWLALRFGQRGASAAVLVVSGVAIMATLHGSGPFIRHHLEDSLVYLQTFMAVVAITTLSLAASISERNQIEEDLRLAERRFELALENSDITAYSQDTQLRYTWIYNGKRKFDPSAVVGLTDEQLAPPDEAGVLKEIKQRVLTSGTGERAQVFATTSGQRSVYDLSVAPIRDSEGNISGVGGVANDITELLRYQKEIEALNERLRLSMRETHHRVKNNLQIIAAMVDMQLMSGAETVPAAEVRRLAVHTQTLAAVHDLLTQESRVQGEQPQWLSSKLVIERLVEMLARASGDRPILAEVTERNLSAKQSTSIAIVVTELVGNALKHGSGTVTVAYSEVGECGVLDVMDDGPGFPPDFSIEGDANTGLELVKNLSRLDLCGELTCFNRPEGGACVHIVTRDSEAALGGVA